ncbi:chromate resistance protein ChrB domain-containing protein [Aliikangiella coralliicola]|nr:chromate resistance protein ChrB domain-containing protein [Aliikangiella coralliicola]
MGSKENEEMLRSWLVLIHHFPQEPGSLRVKIWRRLQSIGAVAIKNSMYVLPLNEECREDFEWILRELTSSNAEGAILESRFVDGLNDQQIIAIFDEARNQDYSKISEEMAEFKKSLPSELLDDGAQLKDAKNRLARFRKRLIEIEKIDFFGADKREPVKKLYRELTNYVNKVSEKPEAGTEIMQAFNIEDYQSKIWVTRTNVHVDRIASAWLIRRWIDADATFKFTSDKKYSPKAQEIRFDMYEAEFTHEGDKCTFEVLIERLKLHDSALQRIGEIVHDIDLKEDKYGHEETTGIAYLLSGIAAGIDDDELRIKRGEAMFDDLYQFSQKQAE